MSFDIPSCVEGRKPRKGRICIDFFTVILSKQDSLAVSVRACRLSSPSSSLTRCIIYIPRNVNHETFRDIGAAWRGIACGGPRNVPRSVSCSFNACIGTPILNVSLVYDFLAVTFHSISRKVARYLGQCTEVLISIRLRLPKSYEKSCHVHLRLIFGLTCLSFALFMTFVRWCKLSYAVNCHDSHGLGAWYSLLFVLVLFGKYCISFQWISNITNNYMAVIRYKIIK